MSNFYNRKGVSGAPIDMSDDSRTVVVYYSAFGNVDSDGDIITPGAFTKSLKENGPQGKNRIWHLFNHSTDKPIAKPYEMMEDSFGLKAYVKMPNTTLGRDTYELYKDGHITEHSIGFQTVKSAERSMGVTEITEIKLFEGSSVLWGANSNTPTVMVKSEIKATVIDEISKTIKSLRNGLYTDETFGLLELKLKQLQQYLAEMEDEESVPSEEQPPVEAPSELQPEGESEDEALEEEENPTISIDVEVNNYLKSFKIFN
jgi:HK97 family phage prohead protease